MAEARTLSVRRNVAFAATLLAGGYGLGEADFETTIRRPYEIAAMQQVPAGNANCTRLDTIDSATGNTGVIEATALNDPAVCWQVNGIQVPSASPNCARLNAMAAALAIVGKTRDDLDYTAAGFRAVKLDDPGYCWQADGAMTIPMLCVPE